MKDTILMEPTTSPPNGSVARAERSLILKLYEGRHSVGLATVAVGLLFWTFLYWRLQAWQVIVWGALQHLGVVVMLAWYRRFAADRDAPDRFGPLMRQLHGIQVASGLLWGLVPWLFAPPGDIILTLLVVMVLTGVVSAGIAYLAMIRHGILSFGLPIALCLAGALLRESDGMHLMLAAFVLLHFATTVKLATQQHATMVQSMTTRFEKELLAEQLRHEKDIAERANLAKSKFLAAASHDLRQPLHAMSLFVAAMEDSARFPETREMVGNVQRCTTALESLLQTLLDISRIDAGVIEPRPEHFRLFLLVNRLVGELSPQAQAAGLMLTAQCPDAIVHSDPALVERILRNLIGNAIRYTTAGSIALRCRAEGDEVAIEVADTGIGIPADQQERVFEEFVQLGNPERDRTKGLGLGLAIVRRLTDLLDARIALESAPGRGSTFRLSLKAGDPLAVAEHSEAAETPINSLQGVIVAVVDDEADVREGMRSLLEGWGCRVLAGEDAAAVIAKLDAAGVVPDIVLADYRLRNDTTGVDAIRTLRDHFLVDIPAAIVTGDTAPERLAEAQASGHLLLHKPLRPAKLRVLLQNLRRGLETTA
jgi:signal transduction histidine kinase/CheY-like chemotaxis protein